MKTATEPVYATIVSCDIVGHGLESDHALQVDRICGLNDSIRLSLARCPAGSVVWASGGDGGHVAFLGDEFLAEAVELVRRLRQWALSISSILRITCHRGLVSMVEGADGRAQLVGEGINLCGSLINFGAPGRVIATTAFRDLVRAAQATVLALQGIEFVNEQVVYLKHFDAQSLFLLRLDNYEEAGWELERSDHRQLRQAARAGNTWQVIYHVKRLLQVNSADPEAHMALNDIQPKRLTHGVGSTPQPLLGVLPRPALVRLLQAGALVERDDGDVICQRKDSGDSMFIVLRGQIGVVVSARPEGTARSDAFDIRIGEGGMVGELALALNRPRTATLQAVGQTALLAVNYDALDKLLRDGGPQSRLALSFKNFLEERIVEHLSRHCPYLQLARMDEAQPLDAEPWERLVDGVMRIQIEIDSAQRLAFGVTPNFDAAGIYILASGDLIEASESRAVQKRLSGERFDILFVNLQGSISSVRLAYRADGGKPHNRITVIRISEVALAEYARDKLPELIAKIRLRMATQMVFDAFISYTSENAELATRWRDAFEASALAVYMNEPVAMARFEPEIDLALSESRVLVPLISRAALKSDWVEREIIKRKTIFDDRHANILPIETEHRLAEQMAVGFAPILAGKRDSDEERAAMRTAIETIREVALGLREPPYLRRELER